MINEGDKVLVIKTDANETEYMLASGIVDKVVTDGKLISGYLVRVTFKELARRHFFEAHLMIINPADDRDRH